MRLLPKEKKVFSRRSPPFLYNILNIKIHSKSFKRKQQYYNTFFQNMGHGGHFRNISKFVLMTFFLKMQQTWTCQNCLPRTSVNGTVWHQFRILPLRIFFSKGISWYGVCYFARGFRRNNSPFVNFLSFKIPNWLDFLHRLIC